MRTNYKYAILFFITLLLSSSLFSQPPKTKVLYEELVLFRSRTERTTTYYQKLEALAAAGIENWDKNVLDEKIKSIDAKPNSDFATGLEILGLSTGWIGVASKGIKIYDYGNRVLKSKVNTAPNESPSDWESELRRITSAVFERAQVDPDFAKIVNKYLGSTLGNITGSAKDILSAFPPFEDHQLILKIEASLSQEADNRLKVDTLLTVLREHLKAMSEESVSTRTFNSQLRTIDEVTTYGNLFAAFIGLKDPTVGRMISVMVNGYSKAANVYAMYTAEKMTAGVASANYALICIEMFNAFNNDNTDQEILKGIYELQNIVIKESEVILKNLNVINDKLDQLQDVAQQTYIAVINNKEQLLNLHQKVDAIDRDLIMTSTYLENALRAGFDRPLMQTITEALGYKQVFNNKYKIDREDFNKIVLQLYTYATIHATDGLASNVDNRSFNKENLFDELTMYSQPANLPYINEALRRFTGAKLPDLKVDAATWLLASSTLIELIGDWPEYQSELNPSLLENVKAGGQQIKSFLLSCNYNNNSEMYENLLNLISSASVDILNDITINLAKQWTNDLIIRHKLVSPAIKPLDLKDVTVSNIWNSLTNATLRDPISVQANWDFEDAVHPGHFIKRQIPFNIGPEALQKFLPNETKLLYDLGLIKFNVVFDYSQNLASADWDRKNGVATINWKTNLKLFAESAAEDDSFKICVIEISSEGGPEAFNQHDVRHSPASFDEMIHSSVNYYDLWPDILFKYLINHSYSKNQDSISVLVTRYSKEISDYFSTLVNNTITNYNITQNDAKVHILSLIGFQDLLENALSLGNSTTYMSSKELDSLIHVKNPTINNLTTGLLVNHSIQEKINKIQDWKISMGNEFKDILKPSRIEDIPLLSNNIMNKLNEAEDKIKMQKPYLNTNSIVRLLPKTQKKVLRK